jgi:hypothetical protein
MPSLWDVLKDREAVVRGRLAELSAQVDAARTELDRLVVTRETVEVLLGSGPVAPVRGGDDRSAGWVRGGARAAGGARESVGAADDVGHSEAVAAALSVITGSEVPMRAREVCEALGEAGAVQAMRTRLMRMADRGLLVALEPGLYRAPEGGR